MYLAADVEFEHAWLDRFKSQNKNLNIDWILNHDELNLSAKDTKQPKLNETNDLFEFGVNYYV